MFKATQQPADAQDYDLNFSSWFPVGDAIASATITTTPPVTPWPTATVSGQVVKVWVQSLENLTTYKITVLATTTGGRKKEVELFIKCKEL